MNERPAARSNPRPNPNEKLVRVFDTEQESEALVVRGLLESTGIDSDITSLMPSRIFFPESAAPLSWCARKMRTGRCASSRNTAAPRAATKPRKSISVDFRPRKTRNNGLAVEIKA